MIRLHTKIDRELISVDTIEEASWISLYPPFNHGELDAFAAQQEIPLDFITDSLDIDERSRYEREDGFTFILVNTPLLNENAKDNEAIYYTAPIGMILKDGKIITVTARENPIIEKFSENRVKNFNPTDPKLFVLQLCEQNVLRYLECLKKLNLKRSLIEQELYNSSRNRELQQLLRIEKSLVYFVNSLSANELLKLKMKRTDLLNIRELEYHTDLFEDVIIDNGQALEMSNVHTNILSGTMEAYASIVSNNMTQFINRLTVITIVLMVPTLVASFFGMNVQLPFDKDSDYAFYVIIGVSVAFVVGLILFLRSDKRL